jgi:hypothetical protein
MIVYKDLVALKGVGAASKVLLIVAIPIGILIVLIYGMPSLMDLKQNHQESFRILSLARWHVPYMEYIG